MFRRVASTPSQTDNSRVSLESSAESPIFAAESFSSDSAEQTNTNSPRANVDLTANGTARVQELNVQPTFQHGIIDMELDRINRFVANIENNLAEMGLQLESDTTPIYVNVRQPNAFSQPVDTIDLSHFEFEPQIRSARVRTADTIIDLCTPPRRLPDFIDLDSHEERAARPALTRRCAPLLDDNVSPPKRQRGADDSFESGAYKCPVCIESVHYKEPTTTKCGHVFCKDCIQAAIRATRKCPLCNKKLTLKQTTRIYI